MNEEQNESAEKKEVSSHGQTQVDQDESLNLEGLEDVVDVKLLQNLTPSERKEAVAAARAAKRAEERAAERALLKRKQEERERLRRNQNEAMRELGLLPSNNDSTSDSADVTRIEAGRSNNTNGFGCQPDSFDGAKSLVATTSAGSLPRVKFVSKRQREAAAKSKKEQEMQEVANDGTKMGKDPSANDRNDKLRRSDKKGNHAESSNDRGNVGLDGKNSTVVDVNGNLRQEQQQQQQNLMSEYDRAEIKKMYLGREATLTEAEAEEERRQLLEQKRKRRRQKKQAFKFQWDDSEDTLGNAGGLSTSAYGESSAAMAADPLYVDLNQLVSKSQRRGGSNNDNDRNGSRVRANGTERGESGKRRKTNHHRKLEMTDVNTKPLEKMTPRDWRIVRENYDIRIRGGKAPPPLRNFHETTPPLHPAILYSIDHTFRFTDPSPIQRQAIPIGLQRRDLIGIAETGSGKTLAFGIPLCHFILNMPRSTLVAVADEGPLAMVLAPTRELALQIDLEFQKLLSNQHQVDDNKDDGVNHSATGSSVEVKTLAVVGGQSIQHQAYELRKGVHIVVGTPGRVNDCIEMAYLVLNQCSYIVLDEADRMIDLGFAPQIENVLDSMGGSLKSENEQEAYLQEAQDLELLAKGVPKHRLTAMFSATMPPEVERMAKQYLRHPAVVSIGDADSNKNTRITQNILYLSNVAQKERALKDLLQQTRADEKIIVFVNEKKHTEGVARIVESSGKKCVVLHGGKSQEQREENLDKFRRGGVVLVATDVAGRGLDIPDVSHVINFNLPSRSIDSYCHRIGRTGRAGKEGVATSFITDEDEGIMAPLVAYLKSTNARIPDKLARHPSAIGIESGPMY